MGLTIFCPKTHRSIDISLNGLWCLRVKIADLAGVGEHYRQMEKIFRQCSIQAENQTKGIEDDHDQILRSIRIRKEAERRAFEEYEQKTKQMIQDKILNEKVAQFLWANHYSGVSLPCEVAKEILAVVKDYDDDTIYGYSDSPKPTRFKDFKSILQDCVDTRSPLIWE